MVKKITNYANLLAYHPNKIKVKIQTATKNNNDFSTKKNQTIKNILIKFYLNQIINLKQTYKYNECVNKHLPCL